MKRIMIIGAPGSGKSTLARWVGERTGLPVYHMDHIHYLPRWQPRPHAQKVEMVRKIAALEEWVFEGGMSSTYTVRSDRADLVIFLDFPLVQRLFRVLRRSVRDYGRTRPDMQKDCPEQFSPDFYRWIVTSARPNRKKASNFIGTLSQDKYRILRSRHAVDEFLAEVGSCRSPV